MRNKISINKSDLNTNQRISPLRFLKESQVRTVRENHAFEILLKEGHESFYDYIEWLGLDKDPDIIILSSMYHYFYDSEEMKHVTAVINLKELNHLKKIEVFLHSVFHILPPESYFIGCFVDNKKTKGYLKDNLSDNQLLERTDALENGIISRIPFLNAIYNFMDLKTNNYLSRENVTSIFENRGFRIIDLTDLYGITYFCAQRLGFPKTN